MPTTKSHLHHRPQHMIIPHDHDAAVGPNGKCSLQRKASEDSATLSTLTPTIQKSKETDKKQQHESGSQKTTTRFAECDNKHYTNTLICQEDLKSLWYSSKQIKTFRKKAKTFAGTIASLEKRSRGDKGDKNKKSNTSASSSYTGLLTKTFQNCCQCNSETDESVLTVSERKKLTKHVRDAPKRLGLERMVVPMNRFEARKQLLQAVIRIQNETLILVDKTNNNNSKNKIDDDEEGQNPHHHHSAEQIRQVCESLSRPYRLFARHLAQALVPKSKSTKQQPSQDAE